MRLTSHSDYAMRMLLYLACAPARRFTSREIAEAYGLSHHHLAKVAQHLGELGLIRRMRGRGGGIELAQDPRNINVGQILRQLEPQENFIECFSEERNECIITPACKLRTALKTATDAFYESLDELSLADLVRGRRATALRQHLALP